MTQSLFWREKVVRRLTIIVLCLSFSPLAFSQAVKTTRPFEGKITLQAGAIRFDDLINKLSEMTGLNFIYSSNKIETKKVVSVSFRNNALEEVFLKLGGQMSLSFKRRDSYVIILRNAPAPKAFVSRPLSIQPDRPQNDTPPEVHTENIVAFASPSLKLVEDSGELLSRAYFKERLHHYFDTALLMKVPVSDLRKINVNNSHRGWFFSGGMAVNNYSMGPEMQLGVRSLYLTVGKRFMKSSVMTTYGLGTSFLLSRNFSLNPSYTHGILKQSTTAIVDPRGIVSGSRIKVEEHQLKFLVQYAIDKKISLRFGPTLSYLDMKRLDYYSQSFEHATVIAGSTSSGEKRVEYYHAQPTQPAQPVKMLAIYTRETYLRIGWEASLAFRLNFFERP
jgi:hypothetical protein